MRFQPFDLERLQSIWENRVAWNLAESGVHPLRLEELADTPASQTALLAQGLGYTQTNGTVELRAAIALMYSDATPDHVQVTSGGSEANFIALARLLEPGDEAVLMTPNYMQAIGIARAFGASVKPWPLAGDEPGPGARWRPDISRLESLVSARTKLVVICNPNNPTGARFTAGELDDICRIAGRAGAWLVSDEIYRGAELDGVETPSAWGRYDRVIVTSGLSKAYGLPGLRIGWAVAPPGFISELWGVHDYTTIAPAAVSDLLARIALEPARRELLIARTRGIVRTNYQAVRRWIDRRQGLSHIPPEAGAIAFVRYDHDIRSTALIERCRDQKSVLVVPGDHFEMDGYLRIGFGTDPALLAPALERLAEVIDAIPLPTAERLPTGSSS
jgi:aspartate/methionine/tyrosine aminotransferase